MKLLPSNVDLFYKTILGKRIICFGAGKMPVDAIKILKIRDVVEWFYDNSESKWDTCVGVQGKKYNVYSPAELIKLQNIQDIVFLITNRDHYKEILQQLNSNWNLKNIEVFIYPLFDLSEIYSYQKTEKFVLIQKYLNYVKSGQTERQLDTGIRLINYIFNDNMFWVKGIADIALKIGKKLTALKLYTKLVNAGYDVENNINLIKENFSVYNEETSAILHQNLQVLKSYPHTYGELPEFNTNLWEYFCEDNTIFPYNNSDKNFGQEIIIREPQKAFCNIEDNGKPVFLTNVYNEWTMIYLSYIVRDSKKYGADNYIYLYYDNVADFHNLLCFADFSFLNERPKFVFLIGEDNKGRYPLNASEFCKSEPEMLEIEEMQHICILISNGDCGSGFFTGVMAANNFVVGNEDKQFYYYSKLPECFNSILMDTKRQYTYDELLAVFEDNIDNIIMPMDEKPFSEYVEFFRTNYQKNDVFNVADIWKMYFIAKYYLEGGAKNTRFVPCIFWDIHNGKRSAFFNMLKEFALVDYFAPVRDPIIKLVRSYDRNLFGTTFENHYDDLGSRFMSGFNQRYSYPDAFEHKYVVAKFEDCKLYPKEMFRKICYTLCIPYQDLMIDAEARESGNIDGECIKGFDLLPVKRKINHVFSDLDKVKLEIFYSQISEHYGYDYYDFEEQPLTDEEVEDLFAKPFRVEAELFEKCYARVEEDTEWKRKFDFANTTSSEKIWFDSKEELRETLKKLLIKGYRISRYEKIRFPFFIRKSIEGTEFEELI